jgi:hypothetical protein
MLILNDTKSAQLYIYISTVLMRVFASAEQTKFLISSFKLSCQFMRTLKIYILHLLEHSHLQSGQINCHAARLTVDFSLFYFIPVTNDRIAE